MFLEWKNCARIIEERRFENKGGPCDVQALSIRSEVSVERRYTRVAVLGFS